MTMIKSILDCVAFELAIIRRPRTKSDAPRTSAHASSIARRIRWLAGLELLLCVPVLQAGEFFIRDGDRVVFLGDSITEQRLYTTYIEACALSHR
jgi:hypothetical protein